MLTASTLVHRYQRPGRESMIGGDLDDVVRKARHLDPSQRYGSAVEMAADLRRLLERSAIWAGQLREPGVIGSK